MKTCYIMSGVAGSGKSTWIKNQPWCDNARIFSVDNYFMKNDKYNFDPAKLSEAHDWNLLCWIESCQRDETDDSISVIDNTNTTTEEIAPYYAIAKAYEHEVHLITLSVDQLVAWQRNVHGVPLQTIIDMKERLRKRVIPSFWKLASEQLIADVSLWYRV